MVVVRYQKGQTGPSYCLGITIDDERDSQYLFQDGYHALNIIVYKTDELMQEIRPSTVTYEQLHMAGVYIATMQPDTLVTNNIGCDQIASWMVYFTTSESYSTPIANQDTRDSQLWTITFLRGQMTPLSTLEVVCRFDCQTGLSTMEINDEFGSGLTIEHDDEVESNVVVMTVDISSSRLRKPTVSAGLDGDPLVILPKRNKKSRNMKHLVNNISPTLTEPELSQYMFDESLVILPKKC